MGILSVMNAKKNIHGFDFYCILFFILSFAGWVWEVMLYLFREQAFVNRGVYKGPYLPIYGVGGLFIYFLLHRMNKKPLQVFCLSLILCTVLEYLASWFLEARWGIRWWDYSDSFLNISGRVCLLGALGFGMGGMALVCFLIPLYERLMGKVSAKARIAISILLLLLFTADAAYGAIRPNTGYGITMR